MSSSKLVGNLVRWTGLDADRGALGLVLDIDRKLGLATVMWTDMGVAHHVEVACLMLDSDYMTWSAE